MNKIVSSKNISSMFLATVLLVGTFALMSPSLMNNAQAVPGYEKKYGYDKPYDKPQQYPSYKPDYNSKSKDTIGIKKVNCNNANLNVNDVSVNNNVGRPPVGDFTTLDAPSSSETGEQDITTNNFANGEKPNNGFMKDKDGFVYVCINNNNNVVGEEPDLACEECFAANSALQTVIIDGLEEFEGTAIFIIAVEEGQGEGFIIGPQTDTIEQLCAQIENAAEELGLPLSDLLLESVFSFIVAGETGSSDAFEDEIDDLIECLLEAGLIIHVENPFLDSISANGIAGANVQCTGDPICAKIEQQ